MTFDPSSLLDIAGKLGLIEAVKAKLLRNPDAAADKLVAVLGEISKIYGALEAELVRYLSLSFDPKDDPGQERAVLLTLEGGQLRTRVMELRGHCHKIWNIYDKHLRRWFHSALSPSEAAEMENLFRRLSYADSQMESAIDDLTRWLSAIAEETLDLVDAGSLPDANTRVRGARKEIQATREANSTAMTGLLKLQGDFISMSGTL
jgi:hypothetical protein